MPKQRILIVDDNPSVVKYVRANMEASSYATAVAINGNEALKAVELEHPDLILLDIMMPEMDGFEVCRRLREWSIVPILCSPPAVMKTTKLDALKWALTIISPNRSG